MPSCSLRAGVGRAECNSSLSARRRAETSVIVLWVWGGVQKHLSCSHMKTMACLWLVSYEFFVSIFRDWLCLHIVLGKHIVKFLSQGLMNLNSGDGAQTIVFWKNLLGTLDAYCSIGQCLEGCLNWLPSAHTSLLCPINKWFPTKHPSRLELSTDCSTSVRAAFASLHFTCWADRMLLAILSHILQTCI